MTILQEIIADITRHKTNAKGFSDTPPFLGVYVNEKYMDELGKELDDLLATNPKEGIILKNCTLNTVVEERHPKYFICNNKGAI